MRPLPAALAVLVVVGLLPAPGGAVTETTAVLDRFEGDRAVLVTDGGDRFVVHRSAVPPAGRHVDAVLAVVVANGRLLDIEYDARETSQRERRSQARFDALAEDAPSDETDPAQGVTSDPAPTSPPVSPGTAVTRGSPLRRLL